VSLELAVGLGGLDLRLAVVDPWPKCFEARAAAPGLRIEEEGPLPKAATTDGSIRLRVSADESAIAGSALLDPLDDDEQVPVRIGEERARAQVLAIERHGIEVSGIVIGRGAT